MLTSSNGNIFCVTSPLCGEFIVPGEFPTQRPVTRSFDVFFDLRLNKRLGKQLRGWWFGTPSRPLLWRHCNGHCMIYTAEAEHEAQRMLLQHGINCPDVVRNVNEEEFTLETLANDGNSQGIVYHKILVHDWDAVSYSSLSTTQVKIYSPKYFHYSFHFHNATNLLDISTIIVNLYIPIKLSGKSMSY